jgi:hypothetical protein
MPPIHWPDVYANWHTQQPGQWVVVYANWHIQQANGWDVMYANWHTQQPIGIHNMPIGIRMLCMPMGCCVCHLAYTTSHPLACCLFQLGNTTAHLPGCFVCQLGYCVCQLAYTADQANGHTQLAYTAAHCGMNNIPLRHTQQPGQWLLCMPIAIHINPIGIHNRLG